MKYGIYKTNRCKERAGSWHNPEGLYENLHSNVNEAFQRAAGLINVFEVDRCSCVVEVREYSEKVK